MTDSNWPLDLVKGFNSNDAVVGREIEEDPAFRLRREELLRATGAGTVEAIRSSLRALDDVVQVSVIENVELTTSVEGLPGKSFEAIVQGGDDQEIADEIWRVKPAGIETHGTESEIVEDSQGIDHTINYSRPDDIPIYIEVTVKIDPDLYPIDGDDQVKAILVSKGLEQGVGEDVIALQFKCEPLEISGVIDVTVFLIDDVTPPVSSANIALDYNELATLDSSDIDVTTIT